MSNLILTSVQHVLDFFQGERKPTKTSQKQAGRSIAKEFGFSRLGLGMKLVGVFLVQARKMSQTFFNETSQLVEYAKLVGFAGLSEGAIKDSYTLTDRLEKNMYGDWVRIEKLLDVDWVVLKRVCGRFNLKKQTLFKLTTTHHKDPENADSDITAEGKKLVANAFYNMVMKPDANLFPDRESKIKVRKDGTQPYLDQFGPAKATASQKPTPPPVKPDEKSQYLDTFQAMSSGISGVRDMADSDKGLTVDQTASASASVDMLNEALGNSDVKIMLDSIDRLAKADSKAFNENQRHAIADAIEKLCELSFRVNDMENTDEYVIRFQA